jgi:hypothetical protein
MAYNIKLQTMPETEKPRNYFSSNLDKAPLPIRSIEDLRRRYKEVNSTASLNRLFYDLFFKRQDFGVVRMYELLFYIYQEEFQGSAYFELDRHLQQFTEAIRQNKNTFPLVRQQQVILMDRVREYLVVRSQAESYTPVEVDSLTKVVKHILTDSPVQAEKVETSDQFWESATNIGSGERRALRNMIEQTLNDLKRVTMLLMDAEDIQKGTEQFPQESS